VTVLVRNDGDLRVGPGVEVAFYGTWDGEEEPLLDENGAPIVVTLDKSLEPGASTLVTIEYAVGQNAAPNDEELPAIVRAEIDGDDAERECNEDNNEVEGPVDAGDELPDLALVVDDGNCAGEIEITLTNTGSEAASDILVRVYAGDPSSGGRLLGETMIDGPLEPGESESVTVEGEAIEDTVTVWGVADPLDQILECNDANNLDKGPSLECGVVR
jgi:subtilase family serine protease